MPTDTIELSHLLPATPERIFAAWLDAAEHAAMTGSPATVESAEVGGRLTAWDGYIDGSHLALEPGVRILQSWRSNDFPADALDSLLELRLEPAPGGTWVTLRHSDLPEGQGPALLEGWVEFYFVPMGRYFGKRSAKKKAARRKAQPVAKKVLPRRVGRTAVTRTKAGRGAMKRKRMPKRGVAKRPKKAAVRRASRRKGARR